MKKHGSTLSEARVERLSHDGRGVARVAGKTVFIEGALPQERVSYRVLRSRARYDDARVEAILEASAQRVEPGCPHYGQCGGCNLQHLSFTAQLEAKQQQLRDALQRIAQQQPEQWLKPVTSAPWAYRARARLAIEIRRGEPGVSLGLRREGSAQVESLAACPVLDTEASALIAPLAALLGTLDHPAHWHEAWLASGEPGLALGLSGQDRPAPPADVAKLQAFCHAHGAELQIGTFRSGVTSWSAPEALLDYDTGFDGVSLQFHPGNFTQANRAVNRALIGLVIELLQPGADEHALDLFCGLGNFSLPLAKRVARVTGIEGDAALVERARSNARHNGIDNAQFLQADLAQDASGAAWARQRHDLILLDPPRAGAAAMAAQLASSDARRVCYISCDAATLARDTRVLCAPKKGLRLLAAGVLDMFPQTSHFESIALFGR